MLAFIVRGWGEQCDITNAEAGRQVELHIMDWIDG